MANFEELRLGDTLHVPVTIDDIMSTDQGKAVCTSFKKQGTIWLTEEAINASAHEPNAGFFKRLDIVKHRKDKTRTGGIVLGLWGKTSVQVSWPNTSHIDYVMPNELEFDNDSV